MCDSRMGVPKWPKYLIAGTPILPVLNKRLEIISVLLMLLLGLNFR